MGLILQPFEDIKNGSIGLKKHFPTTVSCSKLNGQQQKLIKQFCKKYKIFFNTNLRVWGISKNSSTDHVKKMASTGDTVLFVARRNVYAKATLVKGIVDDPMFNQLWQKNANMRNVNYDRVYLIDKVTVYQKQQPLNTFISKVMKDMNTQNTVNAQLPTGIVRNIQYFK